MPAAEIRGHPVTEQKLGVRECASQAQKTNAPPDPLMNVAGCMGKPQTTQRNTCSSRSLSICMLELQRWTFTSQEVESCAVFFVGVPSRVLSAGSAFAVTTSSMFRYERQVLTLSFKEISCALHVCLPAHANKDKCRPARCTEMTRSGHRVSVPWRLLLGPLHPHLRKRRRVVNRRPCAFAFPTSVEAGLPRMAFPAYRCTTAFTSGAHKTTVLKREREREKKKTKRTHHSPPTGTDDSRLDCHV